MIIDVEFFASRKQLFPPPEKSKLPRTTAAYWPALLDCLLGCFRDCLVGLQHKIDISLFSEPYTSRNYVCEVFGRQLSLTTHAVHSFS